MGRAVPCRVNSLDHTHVHRFSGSTPTYPRTLSVLDDINTPTGSDTGTLPIPDMAEVQKKKSAG